MTKIRRITTGLLAAVLLLGGGGSSVEDVYARSKPVVLGYYTGDSQGSLERYRPYMTMLSTDTLNADENGDLIGFVPEKTVREADKFGMETYALVSNYGENGWDGEIAHRVLTNARAKINLIRQMRETVRTSGYDGINIDFEEVRPQDREALNRFVRDAAAEMRRFGKKTMVSVPAKTEDDPENGWSGAFDYAELGRHADLLQVMTYDEHGIWGEPGSSAGLAWMDASLKFAVSQVPSSKLLAGLPAYGNDWNLSDPDDRSGGMLKWTDARALAKKFKTPGVRDPKSLSMVLRYTAPGGDKHEVWYEDAYGIKTKTRLVGTYKLAGISVYAMGMEDDSFWKALRSGLSGPAYGPSDRAR
ncbi:glycosyl hydrolase family 18 protein [Saccharibacillus sp. O23]|uniref:glycosyl hydrolase family 18 protein n=1 Tax=Saccharibacillus sp. O23 TaxID=2009338 RepID=UPI00211B60B0|nr:glycosyl hydrolase family 18 protein [Saccharibacillus sp. O23]